MVALLAKLRGVELYKFHKERRRECLPKFMAIHTLPEPMNVDPALAKKVASSCTMDAYWVASQAQLNEEGKVVMLVCEWNAKDAESIQDVLDKVPELPTDGIYPMAKMDSVDFR